MGRRPTKGGDPPRKEGRDRHQVTVDILKMHVKILLRPHNKTRGNITLPS